MRRTLLLLFVVLVALAGCSDDGDGGDGGAITIPPTSVQVDAEVPTELRAFLAEVKSPGDVPLRATYRVVRKLGGGEQDVEVLAAPPSWQLRVGDLLFVDGPKPATCRISVQRCVGRVREELLTPVGVFSRFFADAPARALATDARRSSAGEPVFSERSAAGVDLRCAAVPQLGETTSTFCLTPEGVFGFVDTPSARYELTHYEPGPPGEPTGVPYPLVADDSFLSR